MGAPLVNAAGISKSYGPRTLLDGVDLVLEEGDRVGVIGPNGAGKTTLLEILAGAVVPDAGTVIRRRGLRVGFVPQEERLDPEATVFGTVLRAAADAVDPATMETEVEREVRLRIVLDQAGFTQPDRPTGELSGGWRKRVAIAAALARSPDVLLLDEPTSALDPESRQVVEARTDAANLEDGVTVLLVSHNENELHDAARPQHLELGPPPIIPEALQ